MGRSTGIDEEEQSSRSIFDTTGRRLPELEGLPIQVLRVVLVLALFAWALGSIVAPGILTEPLSTLSTNEITIQLFILVAFVLAYLLYLTLFALPTLDSRIDNVRERVDSLVSETEEMPKIDDIPEFVSIRGVNAFEEQSKMNRDGIDRVTDQEDPAHANIIVYSASSPESRVGLSRLHNDSKCQIKLLLKHPRQAARVDDEEPRNIVDTLATLEKDLNKSKEDFLIRFYHQRASVRGTKIDDFLFLGHYMFEFKEYPIAEFLRNLETVMSGEGVDRPADTVANPDDQGLLGPENAVLELTNEATAVYQIMNQWYKKHFLYLWETGVPPKRFYDEVVEKESPTDWEQKLASLDQEWLKSVSSPIAVDEVFPDFEINRGPD